MACSKCCVLTIARTLPALFDAQYGVTISTLDSHASTLKNLKTDLSYLHGKIFFSLMRSCFYVMRKHQNRKIVTSNEEFKYLPPTFAMLAILIITK